MSAVENLRAVADGANRDFDSVHDFFEHSKVVWQSFKRYVSEGERLSSINSATGTAIDQEGLVRLAPQYRKQYLATFTFRQFVSTFESFFFDFFHCVLQHNPWPFARCQLEFDAVLKARDREEIIAGVLRKQINELKYENVRDWFIALTKTMTLECPTPDEIESLAEVKAARDILEHNAGVANDVYLRKSGQKARYAVGEPIEIDDNYYFESWRLIKKIIADLTAASLTRLAKPSDGVPR